MKRCKDVFKIKSIYVTKIDMETIEVYCEGCGETYTLKRKIDDDDEAWCIHCNWCPSCEDSAKDVYKEWYLKKEHKV